MSSLDLQKEKTMSSLQAIAEKKLCLEPFLHELYDIAPPQPIDNHRNYKNYLAILEQCLRVLQEEKLPHQILKPVRQYAKIISLLISVYEKEHFALPKASQADILRFLMEQHQLSQADLAEEVGGQPAVSNILNGERKLNVRQIEKLSKKFKINPAAFFTDL